MFFPVAPKRDGFGETVRGAGWAESQDGAPGQRVCPPQPDQRETGGRFGSVPWQTPHLAPGGPSLSLPLCACAYTCLCVRRSELCSRDFFLTERLTEGTRWDKMPTQCNLLKTYFLCLGSKQRSVNPAVKSWNEDGWTKASKDTGTGVVACLCLCVALHFITLYVLIWVFPTIFHIIGFLIMNSMCDLSIYFRLEYCNFDKFDKVQFMKDHTCSF